MYVNNTRISKEMLFLSVDASPSLRRFINGEKEKEHNDTEPDEKEEGRVYIMNKKYDKDTIIKCILIVIACVIVYIGACFLDHQRGDNGYATM